MTRRAASYWDTHRPVFSMGIDGWWPDEGDWLDMPARLTRNRIYWEGPQIDRPHERPFALHRNGAPACSGTARSSGRETSIPAGRRCTRRSRSAQHRAERHPLLGHGYRRVRADAGIYGGAVPALVPVRRLLSAVPMSWPKLDAKAALGLEHRRPRAAGGPGLRRRRYHPSHELHNAPVEPICRKYLELRSRLMPYLYSVVHEAPRPECRSSALCGSIILTT